MNAIPTTESYSAPSIILLVGILVVICGVVAWLLIRHTQYRLSTILWIVTLAAVILGWYSTGHIACGSD